jgi:hypothetical protein
VAQHLHEDVALPVLVDVELEPAAVVALVAERPLKNTFADALEGVDALALGQLRHPRLGVGAGAVEDRAAELDHGVAGHARRRQPGVDLLPQRAAVAERARPSASSARSRSVSDAGMAGSRPG